MANDLCDNCNKHPKTFKNLRIPRYSIIDGLCDKCFKEEVKEDSRCDFEPIKKDPMPNKLTPCEIEVLMYLCRNCPRNIGGLSSEIVSATRNLIYRKLIEEDGIDYLLTEGGNLLVEALCSTPLPVQKWVMPND